MIDIDVCDSVAVVSLDRAVTNALDLELVSRLAEALGVVTADRSVGGVVLRSSNAKFFSIGFDIPALYHLPRADFEHYYRTFNETCMKLYELPKPTVASIGGHAVAGGCILALCCDYRFIAAGRKLMGLNEIKLGVPVPFLADCILRHTVGARPARDIMESGELYLPEQSAQLAMVDEVVSPEGLESTAINKVGVLGAMPGDAFQMIKRNRVEPVAAQVRTLWEERARIFVQCWYAPDTRERLRQAMEKF